MGHETHPRWSDVKPAAIALGVGVFLVAALAGLMWRVLPSLPGPEVTVLDW
jgi:hypothetical protein